MSTTPARVLLGLNAKGERIPGTPDEVAASVMAPVTDPATGKTYIKVDVVPRK